MTARSRGAGQPATATYRAAQGSFLADADLERLRPGSIREWNPDAAAQYMTGVGHGWHAIDRAAAGGALASTQPGDPAPVVTAACGDQACLAAKHGTYNRTAPAVRGNPCPHCAWIVAIESGSTGREVALLTPSPRDADPLARAGADPLLAITICQAILAAESGPDGAYGLDHPATTQILAHATRHRPVLLVPEDCAEDPRSCSHRPDGPASEDWHCDYPDATAACRGCTLYTGGWAGSWAETPVAECVVRAPCSVLLTLAASYGLQPAPGRTPRECHPRPL